MAGGGSSLPNLSGNIVSIGFNCSVRVGENASDTTVIGFASEASYNENFSPQKCTVIGHFGPISIDPQDYDCQITISSFVPAKVLLANADQQYDYPNGKTLAKSIFDLLPSRQSIAAEKTYKKIGYLDFFDEKSGTILAKFNGVVVTSDGVQLSPNSYTRGNVQMMALERLPFDA